MPTRDERTSDPAEPGGSDQRPTAPNPGRNLPAQGLRPDQILNHDQQSRTNEDLTADRM